ncbi:MAG: choice-of-anchor Q domain-containing protein [Nitriliruptoraceae bacterium]
MALFVVLPNGIANAATLTIQVTTTEDVERGGTVDSGGDAACETDGTEPAGDDECTLRAAVQTANDEAGEGDHVVIELSSDTYVLDLGGADEDDAATGDLDLRTDVTIAGAGADVTSIDADDAGGALGDRVFDVPVDDVEIAVEDLSITGGDAAEHGGALRVTGDGVSVEVEGAEFTDNESSSNGGAIAAPSSGSSAITIDSTVFATNTAKGGGAVAYNQDRGPVIIRDSTFEDNEATDSDRRGGAVAFTPTGGNRTLLVESSSFAGNATADDGGALAISGTFGETNKVTIRNSTFSDNEADNHGGGIALSAMSYDETAPDLLQLDSVTLTQNVADADADSGGDGDGLHLRQTSSGSGDRYAEAHLRNTINSNGTGDDCATEGATMSLHSEGHNIDGDDTCELDATGDQPNTDPKLESLADNGGPTPTHALPDDSPAIDAGSTDLDVDQRGEPRPSGGASDIGAFEYQMPTFEVNSVADATLDDPNGETCDTGDTVDGDPECTLRAAVQAANNRDGLERIELPDLDADYVLDIAGSDENDAETGDLDLTDAAVQIVGTGTTPGDVIIDADTRDSGGDRVFIDRVLDVHAGELRLENLTIAGGRLDESGADGGAVRAAKDVPVHVEETRFEANSADEDGGAIYTEGPLTVVASTFTDNVGRNGGYGGAIFTTSEATITDSWFDRNLADGSGLGGALSLGGTSQITGSTFSDNVADGSLGGAIDAYDDLELSNSTVSSNVGGALMVNGVDLTLDSVTLTGNTQHGGDPEGVQTTTSATVSMRNSILTDPCETGGTFASNGYNLGADDDVATTCELDHADDLNPGDPGLASLAGEGGPTPVHRPDADGPAIDAGSTDLDVDQRGEPRPDGSADDVGAVELQSSSDDTGGSGGGNRSPQADDLLVTLSGQTRIDVLAEAEDPDGDKLRVEAVTDPDQGTTTVEGDEVVYAPQEDFIGTDEFEYTVRDGRGGVATATVTVRVVAEYPSTCPTAAPDAFPDDDASVHAALIDCAAAVDLVEGLADGNYYPSDAITRGQWASLIARLVAEVGAPPADPSDAFIDDDDSTHETAIDQLAAADIVDGYDDDRFGPDRLISRAQAASMVDAAYEHLAGTALPDGPDRFADDDGSVHEGAINRLAEASLMIGAQNDTFAPRDPITRGQAATLMVRLRHPFATD